MFHTNFTNYFFLYKTTLFQFYTNNVILKQIQIGRKQLNFILNKFKLELVLRPTNMYLQQVQYYRK